jgi:hypothetical protein
MIEAIVGAVLLAAGVYLVRKRLFSAGPTPDVGQPPEGAEPMVEPRLQDTGLAAYELPLTPSDAEPGAEPDGPPG